MSEERRDPAMEAKADERAQSAVEDDDDDVESPFDHPAFLPVILWGLSIWFGYDGWINQDPEMLEHVAFNRWGFGILVIAGIYFTIQAVREIRADREAGPTNDGDT
jgi:hypothetical protein